ncbi:hypothetical protein A0H81_07509 [Grifola frondosa]|uniref:MARVEL domain-containing protein n=1 Tax=Grifola frondosa TaxID=5627 RepID=A0A1C7M720_GRIFR|nr:hypothetical protein A0H81_07509 [Grifola frondosa]
MPFLDTIQNTMNRVLPEKKPSLPMQASTTGGIGSGGMVPFEDDLRRVERPLNVVDRIHICICGVLCCALRNVHVHVPFNFSPTVHMALADTGGYLVFLLFIPLLSTLWIWMIVSKPAIIFHLSQVFFNFLAMCCMASVASFQAKWGVGPSGLSGFAVFVSVAGIVYSLFMLLVPVIYEKYDKGARLARALKEVRVGFILATTGTVVSLLISFIVTISAWTEAGCKNADNDPHADKGDDFKKGLSGWCSTKKAGAIFFWLAFIFWLATLTLAILDWRNGKSIRPRDPPFAHPLEATGEGSIYSRADGDDDYTDEEAQYQKPTVDNSNAPQSPFSDNRYAVPAAAPPSSTYVAPPAQSRPSIDAYGAFSDPAPTGFGAGGFSAPTSTSPANDGPRVSRTMQYADPYAAVRATITAGQHSPGQVTTPPPGAAPPGYSYGGYS